MGSPVPTGLDVLVRLVSAWSCSWAPGWLCPWLLPWLPQLWAWALSLFSPLPALQASAWAPSTTDSCQEPQPCWPDIVDHLGQQGTPVIGVGQSFWSLGLTCPRRFPLQLHPCFTAPCPRLQQWTLLPTPRDSTAGPRLCGPKGACAVSRVSGQSGFPPPCNVS